MRRYLATLAILGLLIASIGVSPAAAKPKAVYILEPIPAAELAAQRASIAKQRAAATSITAMAVVASCSQGQTTAYEHTNFAGDWLTNCYSTQVPSHYNVPHSGAGYCSAIFQDGHDDWNDCISSAKNFGGTSNKAVCYYTNANYGQSEVTIPPGWQVSWPYPGTFADSISSQRWGGQGAC